MYEILYLTEKTSEHPIAVSICSQIAKNIPSEIDKVSDKYTSVSFKNRNGEGVVSTICVKDQSKNIDVLCGNSKLMEHFGVLAAYPDLAKNITYLEEEGKTVVILTIDKIPQLVISLEEQHLSKPESKFVVNFLQYTMQVKVCMITGDNMHSALKVANHLGIPV